MKTAAARSLPALSLCAAGLLLVYGSVFRTGFDRIRAGADDFLAFYAGARLAGTSSLYDPAAVERVQLQAARQTSPALAFVRLPWCAVVLRPLARLSYSAAHTLWFALRVLAVAAFVFLWRLPGRMAAAVVCCWSLPLAAALGNGQDVPFLLLWLALFVALDNRGRPFWAGMVLSLCTAKFHLFLLLPVLFVAHRKWAVVAGAAAGCAVLGAICWLGAPPDWPMQFLRAISRAQIAPMAQTMPTLHGLLPGAWEWPATALVVLLSGWAILRLEYPRALAVALAGGLLIARHAYMQDAAILIPAILILWSKGRTQIERYAAFAAAMPLPWLFLIRRGG